MSSTKKAENGVELDLLHASTLHVQSYTDRQAVDKPIARLDNLSLMGTSDDMKDEHKIILSPQCHFPRKMALLFPV